MPDAIAHPTKSTWKSIHEKILVKAADGLTKTQIAREMKLTDMTIKRVVNAPYFKRRLAEVNGRIIDKVVERRSNTGDYDSIAEARRIISEAATEAAEKLRKLARSGESTDRVQLDACKDILDRSGLKPIEVVETRERVFTPEDEEKAKAILFEAGKISERLTNQSSPFVIRDRVTGVLESSDTDKAQDGFQVETPSDS
jgi:hypothetical protein